MRIASGATLGAALILAVSATPAFAGGSDGPTPYRVAPDGLYLPAGESFPDGGHVNIRYTVGDQERSAGVHFETLNDQPSGQFVGSAYLPWSYLIDDTDYCITWVQVGQYNEHFGEGGQEPVCTDQPTTPTGPGEPSTPTELGEPTTPTEPGEPTTPTEPSGPGEPTSPTEPGAPGGPSVPVEPSVPGSDPQGPGASAGPASAGTDRVDAALENVTPARAALAQTGTSSLVAWAAVSALALGAALMVARRALARRHS